MMNASVEVIVCTTLAALSGTPDDNTLRTAQSKTQIKASSIFATRDSSC